MISLPDSDDMPVDLFLPPLVAFLFPCSLYLVFFKIIFFASFFSQTQLAIQLPAKQTRPAAQLAMHFPAEEQPGLQHIRSFM